MISRRNLVIMLMIMGIVFVMFQFSQIARESGNDFEINEYKELRLPQRNEWKSDSVEMEKTSGANWENGDYILFLGDKGSDIGSIVSQWTLYSKRNLMTSKKISIYSKDRYGVPEFLIVDCNYMDLDKDLDKIQEFLNDGVSVVFCNLPDANKVKKNKEFRALLGIREVRKIETEVEGIRIFSGFLLGGEAIYKPEKKEQEKRQDMELTMPWYVTAGGTKTYMIGIMDDYFGDYQYKNDEAPAIIWRNSFGNAQVFCVNGDYMSQTSGLGILSAMINELSTYQVYPVVNAQNTLVVDFPLMSNENTEGMQKIYSRNVRAMQSEIIWPSLISFSEKNETKFTCLMSPKYDYSDDSPMESDMYQQYLRWFNEQDAEVGLSMVHKEGMTIADKVKADQSYLAEINSAYATTSAFVDLTEVNDLKEQLDTVYLSNIQTVACNEDVQVPILSYLTDDVTLQCLTSNTKEFTYTRDLRLKSIETALGYDNAELDMSTVVWPDGKEDQWENIYNDMSSSLDTYWKPFRKFTQTTLTESDQRVRTFLNLDYGCSRNGDVITLAVANREDQTCYFMLRTHDEKIANISGAEYAKIEKDAYLLTIDTDKVTIELVKEK